MKMDRRKALLICSRFVKENEGEVAEAVELVTSMYRHDHVQTTWMRKRVEDLERGKDIWVKRYDPRQKQPVEAKCYGQNFALANNQVRRWERMYPGQRITITLNTKEHDTK